MAALARLLRDTEAGILLNEHLAEDGPTVFAHPCQLGAEGIVSKKSMARIDPAGAAFGSRSAIPPASPCSGSGARFGIDDRTVVNRIASPNLTATALAAGSKAMSISQFAEASL
jgi:hypothetical protein